MGLWHLSLKDDVPLMYSPKIYWGGLMNMMQRGSKDVIHTKFLWLDTKIQFPEKWIFTRESL